MKNPWIRQALQEYMHLLPNLLFIKRGSILWKITIFGRGCGMTVEVQVFHAKVAAQSSDRSERILVEATRLFSENGYAGTRMSDIASAIGVTKPIVYRHFDSKQSLFEALVRRVLSAQIHGACALIDGHKGSARPLLDQLVRDARAALELPGALAPWRIAVGEADRFPDLAAFLRQDFMDPILQSITGLFERAVAAKELGHADPATLARLFCSPIATVAMLLATFGEDNEHLFDTDALLTAHVEGFWRGWSLK
jgi:AcrR family transcriptional regulator